MNFIFPSNYVFKNKLFGFISYTTIFINFFWCFLIFLILNIFSIDLNIKIFLFILFYFPLLIFSVLNNRNENIFLILFYIFKYIFSKKIYFFKKY